MARSELRQYIKPPWFRRWESKNYEGTMTPQGRPLAGATREDYERDGSNKEVVTRRRGRDLLHLNPSVKRARKEMIITIIITIAISTSSSTVSAHHYQRNPTAPNLPITHPRPYHHPTTYYKIHPIIRKKGRVTLANSQSQAKGHAHKSLGPSGYYGLWH